MEIKIKRNARLEGSKSSIRADLKYLAIFKIFNNNKKQGMSCTQSECHAEGPSLRRLGPTLLALYLPVRSTLSVSEHQLSISIIPALGELEPKNAPVNIRGFCSLGTALHP